MDKKQFPKKSDNKVIKKQQINNIILAANKICVFFKPYVIPIPKESNVEQNASNMQCKNIVSPHDILWKIAKNVQKRGKTEEEKNRKKRSLVE